MSNLVIPAAVLGAGLLVAREMSKGDDKAKLATSHAATEETSSGTAGARTSLDPGMDNLTATAVALAIGNEKDPSVLQQFSAALSAAGYKNSADAVSAQAKNLGGT